MPKNDTRRREFVKKAAYIAPAILTLKAAPSFAKNRFAQAAEGSERSQGSERSEEAVAAHSGHASAPDTRPAPICSLGYESGSTWLAGAPDGPRNVKWSPFLRIRSQPPLSFLILGQRVHVDCPDPWLRHVVTANFAAMTTAIDGVVPDLHYRVAKGTTRETISLVCQGRAIHEDADRDDLLFLLEKDITVELQRRRADLLFLHAAAIEWQGTALLLAAESGSGKSTTTWGLLHHGFQYLSDELSPVDLNTMRVFPYPHALCLKQDPPPPYALPASAIRLGRTIHVPVDTLARSDCFGATRTGRRILRDPSPRPSSPGNAVDQPRGSKCALVRRGAERAGASESWTARRGAHFAARALLCAVLVRSFGDVRIDVLHRR